MLTVYPTERSRGIVLFEGREYPCALGGGGIRASKREGDGVTPADKCYDGLRNFNQVRDAVFDGGYAFGGYNADSGDGLTTGVYIAEVIPPPGYKVVRAHDKNVDFGEDYQAGTSLPVVVEYILNFKARSPKTRGCQIGSVH